MRSNLEQLSLSYISMEELRYSSLNKRVDGENQGLSSSIVCFNKTEFIFIDHLMLH